MSGLAGTVPSALDSGANLVRVLTSWSDTVRDQVRQTLPALVS